MDSRKEYLLISKRNNTVVLENIRCKDQSYDERSMPTKGSVTQMVYTGRPICLLYHHYHG